MTVAFVLHRVVGSRAVLQSVEGRTLRIGRGAGCDLRFEDAAVALEHAVVQEDRGSYHLRDLGSVTGTYVNGEPVASARLHDGDEIAIGGYLLRVRRSDPEDPLFLHVRAADADPRPDAPAVAADTVDYGARYRLRRRLLTKGSVAVALLLLALAAVAAVPAARRTEAFRPGDLISVHADQIDAADCSACHTPWRGVTDIRCQSCHGENRRAPAPLHHPAAVVPASEESPSLTCTACHLEHLGRDGVLPKGDAPCRSCHADLALAGGVEPVFAARAPSFAEHPEIRLTVPAGDGDGLRGSGFRRLPVSDPEAHGADPTRLAFGHAKHLGRPLQRAVTTADRGRGDREGKESLSCVSCHVARGRDFAPISFEAHCSRCHALTFDDRFPGRQAEHGPPEEMAEDLVLAYLEADREAPAVREEIVAFLRGGREARTERERTARQEALRAERFLYRSACPACHAIDPSGDARPAVADPTIPRRWLPHARFAHQDHLRLDGLDCADCHAGKEDSKATSDLLLPSIEACTPCHAAEAKRRAYRASRGAGDFGEDPVSRGAGDFGEAAAGFPVTPGPSSCRACHDYHSGNRFPAPAGAAEGGR